MDLREKHALELRAREEWFRVTLTSIGDAVIATDKHGKVTFLNPVAETLTGTTLEKVKGKDIREVFPIFNEVTNQPVEDPVKKVISLGRVVGLANHTVLQNVNGTLIPIEDSAAPIRDDHDQLLGVVLVFHDVTKDRQSQEVLRKTEKLATAARLSATVAHEINNPLEAVVNLIYIAKTTPDAPPALVHQLTLAEHELDRVAHITRQTLGFYRESNVPEMIEIPALIDSVLKLYSNKFKTKNIAVQCEFGVCRPIHGVPGELKQVFSNLISNAADAVSPNGIIRVNAQSVDDNPGSAIQVVIEDDGPGIALEHLDRIFEPFFTTKQDIGTGLGLWITKEIVDRHGGSILVRPKNDGESGGAAFTIHLPMVADGQKDASESA
jgi:PAS domain S-box-containing protein